MEFEPQGKPKASSSEMHAAGARVQELEQLKDEFVSAVSHELRTPLTSIRAVAEILLSEPELDLQQRRDFLKIMVNESKRLTRVTDDVLDLAHHFTIKVT